MGSALRSVPSTVHSAIGRRVVAFDIGRGAAETARELRAGLVEDARPATARAFACTHPECGAKFLLEVGWISQTNLAKAGGDPAKAAIRCQRHRGTADRKIPEAVKAFRVETERRAREAKRVAAARRREDERAEREADQWLADHLRRSRR